MNIDDLLVKKHCMNVIIIVKLKINPLEVTLQAANVVGSRGKVDRGNSKVHRILYIYVVGIHGFKLYPKRNFR